MKKYLLCIIVSLLLPQIKAGAKRLSPRDAYTDSVMHLVFQYAQQVDTTGRGAYTSYAYTKFQIRTNKRNATLMMVPNMYAISHGLKRRFMSEYYDRTNLTKDGTPTNHRMLSISTIQHGSSTMNQAFRYLMPTLYEETLFQNNILSPFHRSNRRYYTYSVSPLPFGMAQIYIYPRIKNTQTVETRAIVNVKTGQITMANLEGEYDMTRFFISLKMGNEGFRSLAPERCNMRANFKFMGNKISAMYTTIYGLPKLLDDSLDNVADTALMAKVRPVELNPDEESIYREYWQQKNKRDSLDTGKKKKDFAKDVLWDIVGDNMLNRISQGFGKTRQGYVRLDPIFNPLYMSYSPNKGVVYKFDVRGSYAFDPNFQLSLQLRGGYSMKQKRLYLNIPFTFNYNRKHEGYLRAEVGNGNRISTNYVASQLLGIRNKYKGFGEGIGFFIPNAEESQKWTQAHLPILKPLWVETDPERIYEFKDNYFKMTNHWRFDPHIAVDVGIISHNRVAAYPQFYKLFNLATTYTSVAPMIGITYSPLGIKGPVVKLDYERSYKNLLNSNIEYERMEIDAQHILYASRRRMFSLRSGVGFYTRKGDHWDFVDYSNFHDNNIPGGWNDDWTGEFELLNSQWYNSSDYYIRGNFTYEAPMIGTAWLPGLGRYIEAERLYVSALAVSQLHPYTEWGYGITTRWMSLGVFAAFKNTAFDGFGFRWSIELFRNW